MAINGAQDTINILFSAKLDDKDIIQKTKAIDEQIAKSQKAIDEVTKSLGRRYNKNNKARASQLKKELAERDKILQQEKRQISLANERLKLVNTEDRYYKISAKNLQNNTSLMARLVGMQNTLGEATEDEKETRKNIVQTQQASVRELKNSLNLMGSLTGKQGVLAKQEEKLAQAAKERHAKLLAAYKVRRKEASLVNSGFKGLSQRGDKAADEALAAKKLREHQEAIAKRKQKIMSEKIAAVTERVTSSINKENRAKQRNLLIDLRAQAIKQRNFKLVRKLNEEIKAQTKLLDKNTSSKNKNRKTRIMGTGTGNNDIGRGYRPGFIDTIRGKTSTGENVGSTFGHKVATTFQYATAGTGIYALMNAAKEGIKTIVEFDTATRTMSAVLGVSLNRAEKLGEGLNKLSTEFGGTQKEIYGVALALGRAGIATDKLTKTTKVVLQMARLTGDTFDQSTSAIISFMQVFGKTESITQLGDKLAYVANVSRLSTQDIGTFSNYALAAAKSAGLTVDAVGGLAAAFSNAGVNASTIGTQIRRFTTLLTDNSTAVNDFFLGIGINQQNLLFKLQQGGEESNQAIMEFINTLSQLDDTKFTKLTGQMDVLAATSLKLMRNNKTNALKFIKDLQNGVEGQLKATKVILDSYQVTWENFWNSLKSNVASGADSVIRLLSDDVDSKLNDVTSKIKDLQHLQKLNNEASWYRPKGYDQHMADIAKDLKANKEKLRILKQVKKLQQESNALDKLNADFSSGKLKDVKAYVHQQTELLNKMEESRRIISGLDKNPVSTREKTIAQEKLLLSAYEAEAKTLNKQSDTYNKIMMKVTALKDKIKESTGNNSTIVLPKLKGYDSNSIIQNANRKLSVGKILDLQDIKSVKDSVAKEIGELVTSIQGQFNDLESNVPSLADKLKSISDPEKLKILIDDLKKTHEATDTTSKKYREQSKTLAFLINAHNKILELQEKINTLKGKESQVIGKNKKAIETKDKKERAERVKQIKLANTLKHLKLQLKNIDVSKVQLAKDELKVDEETAVALEEEGKQTEANIVRAKAKLKVLLAERQFRQDLLNYELSMQALGRKDYKGVGFSATQTIANKKAEIAAVTKQMTAEGASFQQISAYAIKRENLVKELIVLQNRYNASIREGAVDALTKYQNEATDTYGQIKKLTDNTLHGMEDALVNFVKTGKLSFKDLANSIIADLARIAVQKSIAGSIMGFGGLFGFADGGIMSSAGALPLKKYSNGGIADSPQLALFGEGKMNEAYVPLPDGRSIPVTMKGNNNTKTNVIINIENKSGVPVDMQKLSESVNQNGDRTISIVMNAIERNPDMRNAIRGIK